MKRVDIEHKKPHTNGRLRDGLTSSTAAKQSSFSESGSGLARDIRSNMREVEVGGAGR